MQRILTRYRLSYPAAVAYLLRASGYRLSDFWHAYTAVTDWTKVIPAKKVPSSSHLQTVTLLIIVLLTAATTWLIIVWWLLMPVTFTGAILLGVYTLLWIYAAPVLAGLIPVIGMSAVRFLPGLFTLSGAKALLRGWVARRLEAQVVRLIRERDPLIIAVTGSVGKTSTKLAIAHVLSAKYHVLTHHGNYNSEIGLPLSIFEMDVPEQLINPFAWIRILHSVRQRRQTFAHDALVLELGADQPGDIGKFMRYLRPHIGVLTAIAPVHTEQFGSVEAILDEKWRLASGSHRVLINADDRRLMERCASLPADTALTFGLDMGDWRMSNLQLGKHGYDATLERPADKSLKIKTHVIGRHSFYALAAAAAVADWSDVPGSDIRRQLGSWQPVKGRMNPLPGKKGSMILDDTYNSSPDAAIAALDSLYALGGRHIAILGSMNELGEYEAEGHRRVGSHCGKLDLLVTIGQAAHEQLAPAARKAGLKAKRVVTFSSPYDAGAYVSGLLKKGDVVLAKGSQNGVFAEEVVKLLLADPADSDQLVRQSPEWLREKESQFSR